jgi:toxin YoeB
VRAVLVTPRANEDIQFWIRSGNERVIKRINALLESCQKTPETGIGHPERLRFHDQPTYSRRIDRVHRLVYLVDDDAITIISARYHYEK